MAITTGNRFYGEGISHYGEEDAQKAFDASLEDIRRKRIIDIIGKDTKLDANEIVRKFEDLAAAINRADKQVVNDNREFMRDHGITHKVSEWKEGY